MENPFKNLRIPDKAAVFLKGSGKVNALGFIGIFLGFLIIYISFEMVSIPSVKEMHESLYLILGFIILIVGVFFVRK